MNKEPCVIKICGDTTICEHCGGQWDTGDFYVSECPYFDPQAGEPEGVGPWWLGVGFVAVLVILALVGAQIVKLFI